MVTRYPRDPARPHGGVEAVCVNLARALARFDDLAVEVVTLDDALREVEEQSSNGVRVYRLPRQARSELWNAIGPGRRQISEFLRKLGPDVVHAHDTYGLMVKGLRLPRVFTIHGFIYGDTLVSGERFAWARSQLWRRIETSGWADQPRIISISPYVRERLAGICGGVIDDIDNPIGEASFDVHRQEEAGVVFSAAAICPRKNPLMLVEAAARLVRAGVNLELRLAGAITDDAYGARVAQAIRAHRLEEHVKLLGQLSSRDVMEELGRASVFALVSLEENSPMGIEEAMAAGVPVLTSNRCGMPYMVRNRESGFLVDPTDVDDIAARLRLLLSDPALRLSMGGIGRAIALDRYHPDRVAARTREVYLDAIAGPRRDGSAVSPAAPR